MDFPVVMFADIGNFETACHTVEDLFLIFIAQFAKWHMHVDLFSNRYRFEDEAIIRVSTPGKKCSFSNSKIRIDDIFLEKCRRGT